MREEEEKPRPRPRAEKALLRMKKSTWTMELIEKCTLDFVRRKATQKALAGGNTRLHTGENQQPKIAQASPRERVTVWL